MATDFPVIEELIPHRGSLLLLDRVVDFAGATVMAEYTPRSDAWYVDADGNMPAWIGLELMAQAIAAHVALEKRLSGLPPKMGALLGTRSYRSSAAAFVAGSPLTLCATQIMCDPGGLAAYECTIESGGITLAEAVLKAYEPEDFETFMRSNKQ